VCSYSTSSQHFMEPKVHNCIHKSTDPCLMSPQPISPRSILLLFTHLHLGLPSGHFPSDSLADNLYAFLFSPNHSTFPAHLILLDFIILIILGEEHNIRSSSLCSFFPTSRHLIPLRSKYPPQHPVLKHPQSMFLP
jgi:hypothetical protein